MRAWHVDARALQPRLPRGQTQTYPNHAQLDKPHAARRDLHLKLLVGGHLLPLSRGLHL